MPNNRFRPLPGRFGVQTEQVAATIAAGTNSLTANTDTTYYVPTSYRLKRFARATAQVTTVPVDSDGTITAIVYKVSAGTTSTALTAALTLTSLTALVTSKFTTLTVEADKFFNEGDVAKVVVSDGSAGLDTQPVDLKFVLEWEIIK